MEERERRRDEEEKGESEEDRDAAAAMVCEIVGVSLDKAKNALRICKGGETWIFFTAIARNNNNIYIYISYIYFCVLFFNIVFVSQMQMLR